MFDRLEFLLKNTTQKHLLKNIFGGLLGSSLRCGNCGNTRKTVEDFFNLSLEVANSKSIDEGLQKLVKGEIISDYKCEACQQKVELEKKVGIEKLPNTLIIHLQRIVFDFEVFRNHKLNDRVEFPEVLDLKKYMMSEMSTQKKPKKEEEDRKDEGQIMETEVTELNYL